MLPLKMKAGKLVVKGGKLACSCCVSDCATPIIQCDSIEASGTKEGPPPVCGFLHEGQYYATKIETQSGSAEGGFDPCDYTQSYTSTKTTTKSVVEGVCTESVSYSGSSSYNLTGESCPYYKESCTSTQASDGSWSGTVTPENGDPSYPIDTPCGGDLGPTVVSYSSLVTPEPGESTEEMIARITGELPDYPDTWDGGCTAARDLSPDESSFSISKFKWRISHAAVGDYLKVWVRRVTTPEGGSPSYEPLTPYEWSGPDTGEPVYGPEFEESISEDGTVTIEIYKYSCVEGYEPPDP